MAQRFDINNTSDAKDLQLLIFSILRAVDDSANDAEIVQRVLEDLDMVIIRAKFEDDEVVDFDMFDGDSNDIVAYECINVKDYDSMNYEVDDDVKGTWISIGK